MNQTPDEIAMVNPGNILLEQIAARERAEAWQNEQTTEYPYMALDKECASCMYICKYQWRFAGLAGATTPDKPVIVGPTCPVLWHFSPFNPLRR